MCKQKKLHMETHVETYVCMYYMGNRTKTIVPVHTYNVDLKCIVNIVIIPSLNYVYSLLV